MSPGKITGRLKNWLSEHLLGNMKELVVLLLFPNRLASREEHLDVLVEVSVLEELAVVLQEADQLLPGEGCCKLER